MTGNPARIEDLMRYVESDQAPNEKTAEAAAPPELAAAMNRVMADLGQRTKTASEAAPASEPTPQLLKLAQEVASIDRDGEIKHAQLVGAAMADAFVARVGQWESVAASLDNQKTASQMNEGDALAKFASENPAAYNAAVQQGYMDAQAMIEKVGQSVAAQGYQQKVAAIHETAARHYLHASQVMTEVAQALSR